MMDILTQEHKDLINKKIKKALNELDYKELVTNYIEREFDTLWDDCKVSGSINDMVVDVIREKLVEVGLLKGKE